MGTYWSTDISMIPECSRTWEMTSILPLNKLHFTQKKFWGALPDLIASRAVVRQESGILDDLLCSDEFVSMLLRRNARLYKNIRQFHLNRENWTVLLRELPDEIAEIIDIANDVEIELLAEYLNSNTILVTRFNQLFELFRIEPSLIDGIINYHGILPSSRTVYCRLFRDFSHKLTDKKIQEILDVYPDLRDE